MNILSLNWVLNTLLLGMRTQHQPLYKSHAVFIHPPYVIISKFQSKQLLFCKQLEKSFPIFYIRYALVTYFFKCAYYLYILHVINLKISKIIFLVTPFFSSENSSIKRRYISYEANAYKIKCELINVHQLLIKQKFLNLPLTLYLDFLQF